MYNKYLKYKNKYIMMQGGSFDILSEKDKIFTYLESIVIRRVL